MKFNLDRRVRVRFRRKQSGSGRTVEVWQAANVTVGPRANRQRKRVTTRYKVDNNIGYTEAIYRAQEDAVSDVAAEHSVTPDST